MTPFRNDSNLKINKGGIIVYGLRRISREQRVYLKLSLRSSAHRVPTQREPAEMFWPRPTAAPECVCPQVVSSLALESRPLRRGRQGLVDMDSDLATELCAYTAFIVVCLAVLWREFTRLSKTLEAASRERDAGRRAARASWEQEQRRLRRRRSPKTAGADGSRHEEAASALDAGRQPSPAEIPGPRPLRRSTSAPVSGAIAISSGPSRRRSSKPSVSEATSSAMPQSSRRPSSAPVSPVTGIPNPMPVRRTETTSERWAAPPKASPGTRLLSFSDFDFPRVRRHSSAPVSPLAEIPEHRACAERLAW